MVVAILLGLVVMCLCALRYRRYAPVITIAEPLVYQSLADVRDILSGEHFLKDTFWGPAPTLLQSRAVPNERPIRAFGIDNAFTTTDEIYHKEFREAATRLVAEALVQELTKKAERNGTILLVTAVQVVALKMAIHTLFDIPIDQLADAAIESVAKMINKLWIASKNREATDTSFQRQQRDLKEALKLIFPAIEDQPRHNPLNLILPAYETLWRIVLRCFVEVRFRSGTAAPASHRLLQAFLSNPGRDTFERTEGGSSASFIVAEALRLYPPTRRIYRHVTRGYSHEPEIVAADIEGLQRDALFWGEDSLCFNPLRWVDKTTCAAYMPFGAGPFLCPAGKQFAPWMIGMLVAALVGGFGEGWALGSELTADSVDAEGPLKTERGDYSTLKLLRES